MTQSIPQTLPGSREAFEAAVKELFNPGEHSFNMTVDKRYYNAVGTKSYGGQVNPEYAPVDMLWEVWRAALSQPMGVAGIPPGMALVPIELSDQIRNVLIDRCDKVSQGRVLLFTDIWRDILAAAPPTVVNGEAVARKIFEHFQGYMSATFGWQGDDPDEYARAKTAHDEKCIALIAKEIAAALPPGRGMVPMTEEIPLKVNQLIADARALHGLANRLESTNYLMSKEVRTVAYDVEKIAQGIYDNLPDGGIKEGS